MQGNQASRAQKTLAACKLGEPLRSKVFVDAWQCRKGRVMVEGFTPLNERLKQGCQMDFSKASRGLGKIPDGALQHGSHTHAVPCRAVMEGHGNLNQSLEKLFVFGRCGAPDVFEDLVRVEELGVVEQADSPQVIVGIHALFWHRVGGTEVHGDVASYVSTASKTTSLRGRGRESTIEKPTGQTSRSDSSWP
jgi:hypothetical protein